MIRYCPTCDIHLIEPMHPSCPVCEDKARKDAEAKVVLMGWQAWRSGRAS